MEVMFHLWPSTWQEKIESSIPLPGEPWMSTRHQTGQVTRVSLLGKSKLTSHVIWLPSLLFRHQLIKNWRLSLSLSLNQNTTSCSLVILVVFLAFMLLKVHYSLLSFHSFFLFSFLVFLSFSSFSFLLLFISFMLSFSSFLSFIIIINIVVIRIFTETSGELHPGPCPKCNHSLRGIFHRHRQRRGREWTWMDSNWFLAGLLFFPTLCLFLFYSVVEN